MKYLIGIDEVGRGPLAGPVTVCAFMALSRHWRAVFRGIRNSKALSPKRREEWFQTARAARRKRMVDFSVASVSAAVVDKIGIAAAVKRAITRALSRLPAKPAACRVLLDGGISAPAGFKDQKTIIRGDEKEPIIALASVVAKVRRDRRMVRLAAEFPGYGFEIHRGYGTRRHYEAIARYGLCGIHRSSFLKGFKKTQR